MDLTYGHCRRSMFSCWDQFCSPPLGQLVGVCSQALGCHPPLVLQKIIQLYIYKNYNIDSNGSNIFGTMEICSRQGQFEPLMVNHSVRSVVGKWGYFRSAFSSFYWIIVCCVYSLESPQWGYMYHNIQFYGELEKKKSQNYHLLLHSNNSFDSSS